MQVGKAQVSKVTRRGRLSAETVRPTTNAGLWLDKFIKDQEAAGGSRSALVEEVAGISQPECYAAWFDRWRQCLEAYGAQCREAEVTGRMVVGLGEDSVLETSIALHHTLGVPYIPGTALKGLASSFAGQQLGDEWSAGTTGGAHSIMFGDTDSAGYVTFFDAMPLPNGSRLFPDVITVHHGEYYQAGTAPPADWDSPNPVSFLSASGKYLIALCGPREWVTAAFAILERALRSAGVGAKTSTGYGRLILEKESSVSPERQEAEDPARQAQVLADMEVEALIRQVDALANTEVAGSIHAFYERWREIEVDSAQKQRAAAAIVAKVREAGREKKTRDKAWYKELLDALK